MSRKPLPNDQQYRAPHPEDERDRQWNSNSSNPECNGDPDGCCKRKTDHHSPDSKDYSSADKKDTPGYVSGFAAFLHHIGKEVGIGVKAIGSEHPVQELPSNKSVVIQTGFNAQPYFLPAFTISVTGFLLCTGVGSGAAFVYYLFYVFLTFWSALLCLALCRVVPGRQIFKLIEKCLPVRGVCLLILMAFTALPLKEPYVLFISAAIMLCAAISAVRDISILSTKLASFRKKGAP